MPDVTPEYLAAWTNWMYRILLYGLGTLAIGFLIAVLVGQELARAYRGSSQPDPDPVANHIVSILLLIAFVLIATIYLLRILQVL